MGFKLRREVRDLLPPGILTANERLLVLELADNCRDDGDEGGPAREGWPGFDWLAAATDIREVKLGETLSRIGKKWVELRVAIGHGKDGRPFFSRAGVRTRYRFPSREELVLLRKIAAQHEAPQNGGPSKPVQAPQNGCPEAPQNRGAEAPQNGVGRPPKMGGPNPSVTPQRKSSSLSSGDEPPAAASSDLAISDQERERRDDFQNSSKPKDAAHEVLAAQDITDEEADQIIGAMRFVVGGQTKGPGWWRTVARNGDLPSLIAQAREWITGVNQLAAGGIGEDRAPAGRIMSNSEYEASVRGEEDCGHGYSGGGIPRPGDGWMVCAICRGLAKHEAALAATQELKPASAPEDFIDGEIVDDYHPTSDIEGDAA